MVDIWPGELAGIQILAVAAATWAAAAAPVQVGLAEVAVVQRISGQPQVVPCVPAARVVTKNSPLKNFSESSHISCLQRN